jgi:hypothetical protein
LGDGGGEIGFYSSRVSWGIDAHAADHRSRFGRHFCSACCPCVCLGCLYEVLATQTRMAIVTSLIYREGKQT